jgi:hypothetical protein
MALIGYTSSIGLSTLADDRIPQVSGATGFRNANGA